MQDGLKSEIIELNPPLEFGCLVRGHELTAKITHIEDGFQTSFHITFSDGYKGNYAPIEDEVAEHFGNGFQQDDYAAAIRQDLDVISGLQYDTLLTNIRFRRANADVVYNVWARLNSHTKNYDVYYKGQYQFSLRKTTRWEVCSQREKGYRIDDEITVAVCKHLDSLQLKSN